MGDGTLGASFTVATLLMAVLMFSAITVLVVSRASRGMVNKLRRNRQ